MRPIKKFQNTSKGIYEDMIQILAEEFSTSATVKWAAEFKRLRDSTENDLWSGCQKTSTTVEQVETIHCKALDVSLSSR